MNGHLRRLQRIEQIRKELDKTGIENGLTDEKTLQLSEELDVLITEMAREQVNKQLNI